MIEDTTKPGNIIRGSFFPEPKAIRNLEYKNYFVHTIGNSPSIADIVVRIDSIDEFNSCKQLGVEYACNKISWKKFLSSFNTRCLYVSLLILKHLESGDKAGKICFRVALATLELLPIRSKEGRSFDGCLQGKEWMGMERIKEKLGMRLVV